MTVSTWGASDAAGRATPSHWVLGVHHVQLSYDPVQRAQMASFYGELLGLQPLTDSTAVVQAYAAGSQRIDLVPRPRAAAHSVSAGHLALQVRDLGALHQRLSEAGCAVLALTQVSDGLRCYAKDPAGNTLELLQPRHLPWSAWQEAEALVA